MGRDQEGLQQPRGRASRDLNKATMSYEVVGRAVSCPLWSLWPGGQPCLWSLGSTDSARHEGQGQSLSSQHSDIYSGELETPGMNLL